MKKTISIIMIILMVVLVSGKCFASDGALDLTDTLTPPPSTNDGSLDLTTPTEPTTPNPDSQPDKTLPTTPNVTDEENLPKTGVADTTAFIVIGVACIGLGIYAYRKMKYYTNL